VDSKHEIVRSGRFACNQPVVRYFILRYDVPSSMAPARGRMAGKIFLNYRRDDSTAMAGRLHDRLARAFGRKNFFVGVDQISAGGDFELHQNNQVAACKVFLTVIGPNWLDAKDKAGQRLVHRPKDSVAIEISAALARNIRVIPVLVDGARMPEESELPDFLKPLARLQAVEVRQLHFDRDAEGVVESVREALNAGRVGPRFWRGKAVAGVSAAAGLLLVGWIGLHNVSVVWPPWAKTREAANAKAQAEAEAKRKSAEAEQQRLETLKAEGERRASAAAEAEAKEAEQQRLAALRANEERHRAEAQARARYSSLITEGDTDYKAGNYDRAIAAYNEAIQLDPESAHVFINRGNAYKNKGDHDRAIADFNEAIRLDPKSALAFRDRGDAYTNKGDNDRAIADFNEAIRLDPKSALALSNRGVAYGNKGDLDRAIADFNEAIRIDPNNAAAFCNRGMAKRNINDVTGNADIAKARQLDPSACR
jgi:tetratricopeptide (TPR) repeat protein